MFVLFVDLCDFVGDGIELGLVVFVGQGMVCLYFFDIVGGMEIVVVFEVLVELLVQCGGDCVFV